VGPAPPPAAMSATPSSDPADLLQTLHSLLEQEVRAASLLLQDIRSLRERLAQSPALPDLATDLPHHAQLRQMQVLAEQRQHVSAALADTPLPPDTRTLSDELAALAHSLLTENDALGQSLHLRLLFFRRLLSPLGTAAASGVYARDGNLAPTLPTRTLDTI